MGEGFRACLTTPQFRCDQFINGPPHCPPASTALRRQMPLHFGVKANVHPHTSEVGGEGIQIINGHSNTTMYK